MMGENVHTVHEEVHCSSFQSESAYRSSAFLSPLDNNASGGQLCGIGEIIDRSEYCGEEEGSENDGYSETNNEVR